MPNRSQWSVEFRALGVVRCSGWTWVRRPANFLDGPLPHGIGHGGPGWNQRVMDADPLQFDRHAIDRKARGRRIGKLPDPRTG